MSVVAAFPARGADEQGVPGQTADGGSRVPGGGKEGLEDAGGPGAGSDDEAGAGYVGGVGGVGGRGDANRGEGAGGRFGNGDWPGGLMQVDAAG